MSATIKSIGIYHPEKEITNSFFEEYLNTSDKWIRERTGIIKRYFTREDEYTSDLCVNAVKALQRNHDYNLAEIDFIIVATSTPDQIIPNVASRVQAQLEIPQAGCIDVSAACGGFVYGLILAKGLIAAGTHKKVLIIGAETMSKIIDMKDRNSCILFGDGAGAVIMEANEENHVFKTLTATDGNNGKELFMSNLSGVVSGEQILHDRQMHQNGRAVFKWAVSTLEHKIPELLEQNGWTLQDVDYFIPHSANIRILESVSQRLDIPMEKCIESIRNFGNTSAASIPLAWHEGILSGKIKPGDNLLLIGFGGGLTSAGICLKNNISFVS
ncbi:MAG: beta-ketoacyl-ACP synthase III [Dysgonamonadaceae bacterium]